MVLWTHEIQCQDCMDLISIETLMGGSYCVFCCQEHLDIYKEEVIHLTYKQVQVSDLPPHLQNFLAGEGELFLLKRIV